MFFLAVLTWATLATDAPKIVKPFASLENCQIAARQAQHQADFWAPSGVKYVCMEMRAET
jgi:hypothetical protein